MAESDRNIKAAGKLFVYSWAGTTIQGDADEIEALPLDIGGRRDGAEMLGRSAE
jgi:hypothetical protein